MPAYVYIHGFNSGSQSRSGSELERIIGSPVYRPQIDYSLQFPICLEHMRLDILEYLDDVDQREVCLLGTSLGGFYILQLRLPEIKQVIAWNPVIYPAVQLKQFVGWNCRFTDNQQWHFGYGALYSYALAPDARVWENAYWDRWQLDKGAAGYLAPNRNVVIGSHDELLDAQLCETFWTGHASVSKIDSGHHIENFNHVLNLLINYAQ